MTGEGGGGRLGLVWEGPSLGGRGAREEAG